VPLPDDQRDDHMNSEFDKYDLRHLIYSKRNFRENLSLEIYCVLSLKNNHEIILMNKLFEACRRKEDLITLIDSSNILKQLVNCYS
jgi:hypothetical protein